MDTPPPQPPGIDALLRSSARAHSDRAAVAFAGREWSYGELDAAVDALAAEIVAAGGGDEGALRGRPIALIAANTPSIVVALHAVWRLGAVAVPLNARLREHEVRKILSDAQPVVVLSVTSYLGYSFVVLLARLAPEASSVRAYLFLDDEGDVEARRDGAPPVVETADALGDGVAAILYTSGTSGEPKGALVPHAREADAAPRLAEILGLEPDDSVALAVPISHAFGLACLQATLAAGSRTVLVDSTTSVRPLLDAVRREQATVLHGSPRLFTSVLDAAPERLPSVRTGFVAGATSPPGLLRRLDEAGMRILNVYGLTEAGAVACCRPDDSVEVRHGTAGRALPGYELRTVGEPDAADGGLGELQIRGPYMTPGYHGRVEETEAAYDGGWFRTGDLATLEDGYLRIGGRSSDIVNVGGFNVVPAEVEAVLLHHPGIRAAAVVGDVERGERLRAFVVPTPGIDLETSSVLRFARDRIAGYKLPYSITVVDDLPLLPSGKLDRRSLSRAT